MMILRGSFCQGSYSVLDCRTYAVKQTGAKLARIDVTVVGKEAQLAEQEARLLSWTGVASTLLLT